jgi:predicted S18 family serine protease
MARTIGEIRARWDVSRWQDWGYEEDEAHSHAAQDIAFLLERVARVEAWVDASPGIDGAEQATGILYEDELEEVTERIDAHLRRQR